MRRRIIDLEWIIKNHMPFFQKFGMEEGYIRNHYEQWKFDKEGVTPNDFLWYAFQNIINAIAEQASSEEQMYQLNYDTYSHLASGLMPMRYLF